ncbi:MAG TPA: HNH endonuclease signature motif containing protein [Anaerovoracaceae bacterium]|nr:HNH endonuclease signature motif containing protein [Anaerovoracaceae bacterium]
MFDPDTTCWNWIANKNQRGCGRFCIKHGIFNMAYRFSYELFKGQIPKGLTIDHLCRNTSCVNPAHLEAVTIKENILRGFGHAAMNSRKTHCPRGHPLTQDNVYHSNGQRRCKTCHDLRMQKNRNTDAYREYNRDYMRNYLSTVT